MTRPITKQFVVRTLNRVARIAYNLSPNDKFAQALVRAGLESRRFRYLGTYLSDLAYLMERLEPAKSQQRACVECGKTFTAHTDHPMYATRRYCSHKCRQRAYCKRHSTGVTDKRRLATRASVTMRSDG
jgi:hypothetical protein